MALERVDFSCRSCGFAFDAQVGAAAPGGAYHRAFWCPRETRVLTQDVTARGFSARCPSCAGQLDLVADFPLDACPRCHAPQGVEKTPQRGGSGSAETGAPLRRSPQ